MTTKPIDLETEFGARVDRRLREEIVGWLVTVGSTGIPHPNAVWFMWDGSSILVFSQPNQAKLRHIASNPNVAFHLDSSSRGDDIVIISGTATIEESGPSLAEIDEYVKKYRHDMGRLKLGTPEQMAADYSVPIRIIPTKARGY